MAVYFASLALGCAIEDGTAFGSPYTIAATPAPRIDGSDLVFTATYSSPCAGAAFEASRFAPECTDGDAKCHSKPAILSQSIMLVVARAEQTCGGFDQEVTEEVRAELPEAARGVGNAVFLACPPGSWYEMVKVQDQAPEAAAAPAFMAKPKAAFGAAPAAEDETVEADDPEAEARRVAEELATQTPEDSVAFLAHCEEKRAAGEPCKCCSDRMMSELRRKIAEEGAVGYNATADVVDDEPVESIAVDARGGAAAAFGVAK